MSREDNSQIFERLVQPHFDRLYRLAWRLAGAKAEAEDLFQELLIRVFEKLDQLVAVEEPMAPTATVSGRLTWSLH